FIGSRFIGSRFIGSRFIGSRESINRNIKRRPRMALTAQQIEQQKKQAEELLFSGPQTLGFAKALFFGHFNAPMVFPYPQLKPAERDMVEQAVAAVRRYAEEKIDARA